jgi:pimeloyl-ACP methyl ester carboxylesterase
MFLRVLLLVFCSVINASKPALVLIPGAFHRASVYDVVKSQLGDVGYDQIDAVDLPSLGYEAGDVERAADVEVVTTLLSKRLKNGSDVILVGNSYGATVAMEAVKYFEAYSAISPHPRSSTSGRILGLIMVVPPLPPFSPLSNSSSSYQATSPPSPK